MLRSNFNFNCGFDHHPVFNDEYRNTCFLAASKNVTKAVAAGTAPDRPIPRHKKPPGDTTISRFIIIYPDYQ